MTERHWSRGIRLGLRIRQTYGTLLVLFLVMGWANAADRVYDAADLVRAARMIEGIIPADPEFADLDGDGVVTAADLDLMLRRVHGRELPVTLDQTTIGSDGGELGDAGILRLIVPAGAFDTDVELTLERVANSERPSTDVDRGPLYEIRGIPDNVPVALTVRVPVSEGADPAGMALEIGEYTHGSMSGLGWFYRYVEPEVDGQDLVWHAPPIPAYVGDRATDAEGGEAGSSARATTRAPADAAGRASYRWRFQPTGSGRLPRTVPTLANDRFRLIWPASQTGPSQAARSNAWALIDGLETAYTTLSADYDFSPRTSWPIDVYIKRLGGEEPGGEMVSSFWGVNYHWIEMDDRFLWRSRQYGLPVARITAAHEFFHVVQSFYHARKDPLWLDEATATWFEKHIAEGDPADYLPEHFPVMPRTALRGMHIEPGGLLFGYSMKDVQSRGYTVASFIEYADRRHNFGLAGIAQVYQRLKAGDHPVLALMTAIPGDASDFRNLWRDYTRDFFDAPVWSSKQLLLADPPPLFTVAGIEDANQKNTDFAFGRRAEGPFGRINSINTLDDYATLREHRVRVQQLGARSVAVAMLDRDFTDRLPDTVRMIGEVQWENEDDMSNLRLMPVYQGGPGPGTTSPTVLPLDSQNWLMHRSTHRVEVSFPRPPGRFTYMLGVFNDDTRAPYNRTPTVTLRHYIGSYRVPPTETSTRLLSPTEPVAVGELRDALLDGDLGTVRSVDLMTGDGMGIRDIQGLMVMLPHDDRTPLRLRLDGSLKQPLDRVVEHKQTRWTITATDDIGWRLTSSGSGIEKDSTQGEVVTAADAWNTGFALSAPEAGGVTQHAFSYYFSVSVRVEDLNEYGAASPYTWTSDSWYVLPLVIILRSPQAP